MTYWLQQHLTPGRDRRGRPGGEPTLSRRRSSTGPRRSSRRDPVPVRPQGTRSCCRSSRPAAGRPSMRSTTTCPHRPSRSSIPRSTRAGEAPVEVDLPDDLARAWATAGSVVQENTFGEFQTSALAAASPTVAAATRCRGRLGWRSDRGPRAARTRRGRSPGGPTWDTRRGRRGVRGRRPATAVAKAGGPGAVLPGEGGTTRWVVIGSDDATLDARSPTRSAWPGCAAGTPLHRLRARRSRAARASARA